MAQHIAAGLDRRGDLARRNGTSVDSEEHTMAGASESRPAYYPAVTLTVMGCCIMTLVLPAAVFGRTTTLTGRTLDSEGNPLAGLVIQLVTHRRPQKVLQESITNQAGRFRFRGRFKGRYNLIITTADDDEDETHSVRTIPIWLESGRNYDIVIYLALEPPPPDAESGEMVAPEVNT